MVTHIKIINKEVCAGNPPLSILTSLKHELLTLIVTFSCRFSTIDKPYLAAFQTFCFHWAGNLMKANLKGGEGS